MDNTSFVPQRSIICFYSQAVWEICEERRINVNNVAAVFPFRVSDLKKAAKFHDKLMDFSDLRVAATAMKMETSDLMARAYEIRSRTRTKHH